MAPTGRTNEPLRAGKGQATTATKGGAQPWSSVSYLGHACLAWGPQGMERPGASPGGEGDRVGDGQGLAVPTRLSSLFPLPHLLRYLCDKVVPGNRVTIMGIYSIKKFGLTASKGRDRVGVGIRSSYIRVLGIQVDTDGSGEWGLGPAFASPRAQPPCCLSPGLSLGLPVSLCPPFPVVPGGLQGPALQVLRPPFLSLPGPREPAQACAGQALGPDLQGALTMLAGCPHTAPTCPPSLAHPPRPQLCRGCDPPGRGGVPAPGRPPQCLRGHLQEHCSVHLWGHRHEEGHRLLAVWGFPKEVGVQYCQVWGGDGCLAHGGSCLSSRLECSHFPRTLSLACYSQPLLQHPALLSAR